ncbi:MULTISPECIES: outer membrane protein assembly factor BamA [unclassified Janthinobacterium]|uniref:outer membrane protein assembly factor BamA n=2 Tax=Janthinobacterium TaxID=29580 RepID=UPI00161FDE73|nr:MULTISPECIES: outer membrane protein assembly factor BamA [unclassified Janthinobacterium]MBB5366535.1 outer membrane protein insertion porin family [Janthinobacterium sp. K2C7]MBB5380987.1 outer membrane protein insertion porin family [Janthinobacterium sp. K2Li3]MBB5384917.1 outer membrane protein insertion porin family [Janthinobacterium sp. K2E3]
MKLHSARFALPSFRRSLIGGAVLALCAGHALAVQPFTVKDIRVEGIQRTEAGTVFSYLPVRVGETFSDEKSVAAIKALYATGFFKDVRLEVDGDVLVVLVEERPAIATVEFTGTKEFEKDVLVKALKEIGVGEAKIFDKASVDRAEQELKRQYLSHGLYGVKITTTVTPIERNRVNVVFAVDEGEVARIKQINIVGNKAFSDKELREQLALNTGGWFSWYTKADQYSKTKLTGDIESLKSFYLDRGYIEMQVDSTQVSITPDKKDIYLTINITEGEKYKVSGTKFEGEMFGREEELKALNLMRDGDIYSGARLTATNKRIQDRLATFGYAFANVNANPDINREKHEVAFTFVVDPGKRVYVRHMNIAGNTTTRDEVIRREFRQFESSWYDSNKIKLSRDRVDRLGYFKDVTVDTPEAQGTNDQVDVNMTVVEKPTGNFLIGGAFSQSEKFTLSASISQANFAGSGNTVGIELNTSHYSRTIALSQTNPYYTDDGISRSFEIYLRTTEPPALNIGSYKIKQTGGRVSYGVPFSEVDTIFFGIGAERTRVETDQTSPTRFRQYVTDNGGPSDGIGAATTNAIPLTAAWQRDSRDSALTPSVGRYQRVNLEADLVGNQKYFRAVYEHQYFRPLTSKMTLALKGELDYGHGIGDHVYPVFKNFYGGGIGSVRGYLSSSLGAVDPTTGDALGGASRMIGSAELQLPFPGSGNDRSLRWFGFVDGGQVYQEGEKMRISQLRYSSGLGISWISPVGPLKLSYAKPLNAKPTDRLERFQFQMGTGF